MIRHDPVLAGIRAGGGVIGRCGRGSAAVETALVLPVLLLLAFGVAGAGRVVHAQSAVSAVAREAAASGAAASSPQEAVERASERGRAVADGYHLTNGSLALRIVPARFDREAGDAVGVTARYELLLNDLPLLGWARVPVASTHVAYVDPYRSRRVP